MTVREPGLSAGLLTAWAGSPWLACHLPRDNLGWKVLSAENAEPVPLWGRVGLGLGGPVVRSL